MSNITKAKKGNKEALIEIIEEYKVVIYKISMAILKNEDDACDAMQETLISICENIKTVKNEKYFKTWVTRIAMNQCYHIIRRQKVNKEKIEKAQNSFFSTEKEEQNIEKT